MKDTLEKQQKVNTYLMYVVVGGLLIMTALAIASTVFGIFRVHPGDKPTQVRPILEEHMPAVGGQVAVTYDAPTGDAINEMIANGYVVESIVYDNLKDQALVIYKRVR